MFIFQWRIQGGQRGQLPLPWAEEKKGRSEGKKRESRENEKRGEERVGKKRAKQKAHIQYDKTM